MTTTIGYEKVTYTHNDKVCYGIATIEVGPQNDIVRPNIVNRDTAQYFCTSARTIKIEPDPDNLTHQIVTAKSCSCHSNAVFTINTVTTGSIQFFLTKERANQEYPYPVHFTGSYIEWFPDGRIRVQTALNNGCRDGEHTVWDSVTGRPTITLYANGLIVGS